MRISERLYRTLLRAYPRAYQRRYAEPMEQLFRDRLRETHSLPDRLRLWLQTLADWAVSVPREYWEAWTHQSAHRLHSGAARQCMFFARSETSSFSRREIKLEHLLLGMLREEPSLVADVASVIHEIESHEPSGQRIPPMEDLRLSRETMRVWVAAAAIARAAGRRQATPRDLAAGILRETDTLAARLLRDHIANH